MRINSQISQPYRIIFVLALVEFGAGFMWYNRSASVGRGGEYSDLTPLLAGAAAWSQGLDPYVATATSAFPSPLPLLYPFPAVLAFLPFITIPPLWVNTAWVAVSTGALAWVVTRDRRLSPSWLMLISPAFFYAIQFSQWSPLLTAAMLTTWGSALYAMKPTTALWLWAYRPTTHALLLPGAVVVFSLAVWPMWPMGWWTALKQSEFTMAPILLPGGPLVLLSLLRWRQPEARLLATMCCVPHTPVVYEAVPLFLIPKTWPEGIVLWAGTLIAWLAPRYTGPYATPIDASSGAGTWLIWSVYLPALLMILRRPNMVPAH